MRSVAGGLARGRGIVLALIAAVALGACAPVLQGAALIPLPAAIPASPVEVADQTKLDEQAGLTVTLAYTGAARLASLAIRTGVVSDPATISAIGRANVRAKLAVDGVRAAYLSLNSASYLAAIKEARAAISALLASVKG